MRFSKLSRSSARTAGEVLGLANKNSIYEEMSLFASELLNGGMVTAVHSHKLAENQVKLAQGFRTRFDGLERRFGSTILTPTKPNSNSILLYNGMKRFNGNVEIFRFTKNSIHKYSSGAWTAVTGAALSGGDFDRFQAIAILDRLFFSNSGVDVLHEINLVANTYAAAGNAKRYKYYTSIHNRIVGANLNEASPNPIELGWSGDLNFTQWDSTIDISAGRLDLLESGGGAGDEITGVFNIDNKLLVARQESLWIGELSPIASFPFNLGQAVPGIGAGIPNAISKIRGGIAWFDKRLNNVFSYKVGYVGDERFPEQIGDPIRGEIAVTDINNLFSAYDPENNSYLVGIIQENSTKVPVWIYNFDSKDWNYDEYTNITGIWYLSHARSSTTIGDLVGTIGDLVGTIGGLSPVEIQTTEFIGKNNGDILIQDKTIVQEGGANFTSTIKSKDYKLPSEDVHVAALKFIIAATIGGTLDVSYSIDGGETFILLETVSYASGNGQKQRLLTFYKNIRCRQFMWKIETTNGRCKIVEYEIHVFTGGDSRGP